MGISAELYPELVDTVSQMVNDDRYDELVPVYLEAAMQAVLAARYPMDPSKTWDDTEGRYDMKACIIAVQLISKRGAEGETKHDENGTSRTYGAADIPPDMLRGIVPMAGVPR